MSGEIGVAVMSDGVEYSEDRDATGEGEQPSKALSRTTEGGAWLELPPAKDEP